MKKILTLCVKKIGSYSTYGLLMNCSIESSILWIRRYLKRIFLTVIIGKLLSVTHQQTDLLNKSLRQNIRPSVFYLLTEKSFDSVRTIDSVQIIIAHKKSFLQDTSLRIRVQ